MKVIVVNWRDQQGRHGVVGVFEEADTAYAVHDALNTFGDKDRTYDWQEFELNKVETH